MTDFDLRTESRSAGDTDVVVISVHGDLDAHTFPKLQSLFDEQLKQGETQFVLDGSEMDYVSSAGLGVLKGMARELRGREPQGDIRLANLTKKIATIVDLLGFSRLLQVHETVEEAVDSYA